MKVLLCLYFILLVFSPACFPKNEGIGPLSNLIQTALTSRFHSNKQIDFIKSDNTCLGYFGDAGAPGQAMYVAICSEKNNGYHIKFIKYNYESGNLEHDSISEIPEETAKLLLSILRRQINAKKDYCQGVLDGRSFEFGIRQKGTFNCAGINPTDANCTIRMMCDIATARSLDDINRLLEKWESEHVTCVSEKFASLNLSKETAEKLAEIYLVNIYGKKVLKQKPWLIEENAKTIKVMGQLPPNMHGGVAEIEIRRSDGKVIRYSHGK